MDLPRLAAMQSYWRKNPPVHLLVASYLDYKPPVEAKQGKEEVKQSIEQFMSMFPVIPK